MSDTLVTIEASLRESIGKGHARKMRRAGTIPAVLLNNGKSTMLEMNPKLLGKAYKNGKKFNLTFNGETKVVTVKELQIDAVKRLPLHVDLMYAE